jgi:hypothetical protein
MPAKIALRVLIRMDSSLLVSAQNRASFKLVSIKVRFTQPRCQSAKPQWVEIPRYFQNPRNERRCLCKRYIVVSRFTERLLLDRVPLCDTRSQSLR